jgi:hypothetical protein
LRSADTFAFALGSERDEWRVTQLQPLSALQTRVGETGLRERWRIMQDIEGGINEVVEMADLCHARSTFRGEIYVIRDTPESAKDSAEDRDNGIVDEYVSM